MKCPVCGKMLSSHAAMVKHLTWWKQLQPTLHDFLMCKPPSEPK